MTVQEYLEVEKIDRDFIEQEFSGPYWESALSFVDDNYERDVDALSEKQVSWLAKILDDCVEKRIEG